MKRKFFTIFSILLALAIVSVLLYFRATIGIDPVPLASGHGTAFAQEQGLSKVIFKVKCYDEGKTALQGLKGIQKIETGFHYLHEVDIVYYDPKIITIGEMETALKKAGTHVETITEKERN
jgi:hypothetical protein